MTGNLARPSATERDRQAMLLCGKSAAVLAREGCTECLAHLYGWRGMHVHPLMTRKGGWRTGTGGDLGAGWPDLVLAHRRHGLLFIEVKTDKGQVSPDQADVIDWLRDCGVDVLVVRDPLAPEVTARLSGMGRV